MEGGHHRDREQGVEGAVLRGPLVVKERREGDRIHLAKVEGRAVVPEGWEEEGLVWNPGGEPPEARVVPCSAGYSERVVGHWEEGEVALRVFRAGAGSSGVEGGRRIHCAAQVDEGRLQKAVDRSCEHQGAGWEPRRFQNHLEWSAALASPPGRDHPNQMGLHPQTLHHHPHLQARLHHF